jgi:signal transduction histidine kinase
VKPLTRASGNASSISSLRRLRTATILLVLSFVAVVVIASIYSIAQQYNAAVDSALRTARNTLRTAEAHATQTFGETFRIIEGIADVYTYELALRPGQPVNEAYFHKMLAEKMKHAPGVINFFILDADLDGVAGSRTFPIDISRLMVSGISFTSLSAVGDHLLVGEPYQRVQPDAPPDAWRLLLGMKVSDAKGTLQGYVFALMDPHFFSTYYRTFDVGPAGRVAMWVNDRLLAASPAVPGQVGRKRQPLYSIPADGLVRTGNTLSSVAVRGTVGVLPVTITVGLVAADFLQAWRMSRNLIFLAAFGIVLAMAIFGLIILRQIRRTEQNEMALRAAKASAEEANDAKSRFLAHMSHEFRTPLNAIMGFSEIIKNKVLGDNLAPAYVSYADHIHRSGEHLLNIVNDILDMAKIESGVQPLQREVINLHNVISAAISFIEGLASQKGMRIRIAVPDVLPAVSGDQRFSRQVMINLLSNAVKFSPPGSEIVVTGRHTEGKHLDICISDNGPGIEPALLKRLGEPFLQGNPAVSHSGRGTGLGLSICKRYMNVLGGELLIDSLVGRGTTATIRFPHHLLAHKTLVAGVAANFKRSSAVR